MGNYKKYFCLCFLFSINLSFSQSKKIDSLKRALQTYKEDTNRVKTLNNLCWELKGTSPDTALQYGKRSINLAGKLKYQMGLAGAYNNIGLVYRVHGEYDTALIYFFKGLEIRKKLGHKRAITVSLTNIATIYADRGDYPTSVKYMLEVLKICESNGDKNMAGKTLYNIGTIYAYQQNFDQSLFYLKKALVLREEIGDKKGISSVLGNMSSIYIERKQPDSAIIFLKRAYEIDREFDDKESMAYTLIGLGSANVTLGKFDEAISYFEEAIAIQKLINDIPGITISYNDIGKVYLLRNNLNKALGYFEQSYDLAKQTGNKEQLREITRNLSDLYVKQNDFRNAYQYYTFYSGYKDSLLNEENNKQVTEMQTKYDTEKKDKELIKKDSEIKIQQADAKQKSFQRNGFIIGFGLMIILSVFIFRSYRQKQKANILITKQKEEVTKQRNLINEQKIIVEHQKELVEEKNKEVMDSIYYARRIQRAVITSDAYISKHLRDYFVFYSPKDIVSGDFYWALEHEGKFYIITADCTGHGVPGAFMSLLNISILNEVVIEKKIKGPHLILDEARKHIIKALNPNGTEETKDGMDCILCSFDLKNNALNYAAANNSFYIIRDNIIINCQADKMPVGKSPRDHEPFTLYTVPLQKGDLVYLLTDGLPDQFGGPKGKKFKYKQLEEILLENARLPMIEQKNTLEQRFNHWKGDLEQVDDVLIIGVRV